MPDDSGAILAMHLFRRRFGIGSARGDRHDVVTPRTPDPGRAGAPRSKMTVQRG
jgi:hypothetical protein